MAGHSTLRRRMIVNLGLMVLGSLTIGLGAMAAVNELHQDLGLAVQGYRELRQLFGVGFFAARARDAMSNSPPQPYQAITALQAALESLNTDAVDGAAMQWLDESTRSKCSQLLSKSIYDIDHGLHNSASLNQLFIHLSRTSQDVRASVIQAQVAADRKRIVTLWAVVILCLIVVIGAIGIGVRQYRGVMGPMRQLANGAKGFAKGDFNRRIVPIGDLEFVSLAADFNQMAHELSALYQDLGQKVQDKSKELVRSERLASVGYLAAGVAHEINNPLGIIAGYGERAIKQLNGELNPSSLPAAQKALTVMCEEAFRCKQITDRLLSLARPGSESRQIISIAQLAQSIVSTLSGLGAVGNRNLSIVYDPQQDLQSEINEGEIKQVLLNLILNALEAVDANTGQVRINITRRCDQIEMKIHDNGQGMTQDTLSKIFQPFFTHKRSERPGTGLGLSVAHSIITDHGGRISAQSQGVNLGSTFTVFFLAANAEVHLGHA